MLRSDQSNEDSDAHGRRHMDADRWRRAARALSRMPSPGPWPKPRARGQRLRYFSFGSVFASSAAMMWYPGVFMWMLKVPSQKYVTVQTLATGTGI